MAKTMNYTKGKWEAYQTEKLPERWEVCAGLEGNQGICKTLLDNSIPPDEKRANAQLICSAVNACASVNPDNPQAVAESIKDMYEALKILIAWAKCLAPNDTATQKGIEALSKAGGKHA